MLLQFSVPPKQLHPVSPADLTHLVVISVWFRLVLLTLTSEQNGGLLVRRAHLVTAPEGCQSVNK